RQLRATVFDSIAEAERQLEQIGTQSQEMLASVGLENVELVQSELEAAAGEALRWQAAENRARALFEPAQQLDNAMVPVRDRVSALEEVAALLRRDAFIKEVCERRQQAL